MYIVIPIINGFLWDDPYIVYSLDYDFPECVIYELTFSFKEVKL